MLHIEELIRRACCRILPQIKPILANQSEAAQSHWSQGSLKNGKALEILAFCCVVKSLEMEGASLHIPPLFFDQSSLFYLRNSVPGHHGAQAGHNGAESRSISIASRFEAAFTPKLVATFPEGVNISIFREGDPFHQIGYYIEHGEIYSERPDWVMTRGRGEASLTGEVLRAKLSEKVETKLRVLNCIEPPIIDTSYETSDMVMPIAFIECSIKKTENRAKEQASNYARILRGGNRNLLLRSIFVSCFPSRYPFYDDCISIDLDSIINDLYQSNLVSEFRPSSRSLIHI